MRIGNNAKRTGHNENESFVNKRGEWDREKKIKIYYVQVQSVC